MHKNREVEFEIAGGIGNQLFMLCAGIFFQSRLCRPVHFDISDLKRISELHPGHNVFTLGLLEDFSVRNSDEKRSKLHLLRAKIEMTLNRLIRAKVLSKHSRLFTSPEIGFINFLEIPRNVIRVKGYFQSWRYTSGIAENFLIKMEKNANLTEWYSQELEKLSKKPFAAFHVRRGDYRLKINKEIGILSLTYFKKIEELLPPDIPLLIFTDDAEEIKREFVGLSRDFRVMEPPIDSDPIESLFLMARASHLAISNSTFSWWAATFTTPGSVVYAPDKWFQLRQDPIDLLPDHWLRIKSDWKIQE